MSALTVSASCTHLLRCERRPCCKTGHREHLHCLQLRLLLFIIYLKVLLCSRPTAVCRDDHSRDKTVIHTERLWCSNSACAPQSPMKEEAWELFFFKSARNAGGGASAVMGVVILIFCDTEQTYSHFFPLTRSSLSWTEVIIPRSCECLPGLC